MKKTLRSIITVLLVFVMLFCTLATAVSAAPAESGSTGAGAVALDQGWIEIAYNTDGISVILRPDKEELSNISITGLKNILSTVLEAVQVVVLDDIKADFASGEYGLDSNADINTIFNYAFEKFLEKNGYADDVAFFDAAYNDDTNARITELADYICKLLSDAVRTEVFALSELPTAEKIENDFYALYDSVAGQLVGVDATITANRAAYAEIVKTKYTDTLAALEDKSSMSLKEVLLYLDSVTVDTYKILSTEDGEETLFNKYELVELINSLPTFDELSKTETSDMAWSWDVNVATLYGESNFKLSVALGEGENADETELYGQRIRRYAGLIDKNFKFSIDHEDTISLSVTVPETVAKIIRLALGTSDVPDSFKRQFYAIFDTPIGEAEDEINALTYSALMAELEKVNFEGIFDSETAKDFIDLSGKTNEQIIDRLWDFEDEFNLAKSLVRDLLAAVPENYKGYSILDLYFKNGAFAYDGSHEIDIEKLFTAITERHGEFLASFFDQEEFGYWTFDLDLAFEKMNRVRYQVDGKTVSEGMLPFGASVSAFGPATVGDLTVGYWVDAETGDAVVTMPNVDTVLTPVYELDSSLWNYTGPLVYNGVAQHIELTAVPDGYEVEYVYTLTDGTVIECPKNAGDYIVNAVFTKNGEPACIEISSLQYTIDKRTVDLTGIGWTETNLVYNKAEQSVTLDVGTLLDGITEDILTYTNNKSTKVGSFTATVALHKDLDTDNYEVILPAVTSVEWTIAKADIDMSGVTVLPETEVDYDGKMHTALYDGTLPEGVIVKTQSYKLPGTYTVKVGFEYTGDDKDCYNPIPSSVATLTIIPHYTNSFEHTDNAGNVIISVNAENGLLVDFKLLASDTSFAHTGYYLEDGSYIKVLLAYDINFAQDGTYQPVEDNFTVKMYMPKSLREKEGVKLVYITDNGDIEELEYTVEGDYLVFQTSHFSTYALAEAADAPVPLTPPDLTWLWILLVVIGCLLIVGLIVLIVLRIRKKNDGTDPTEPDSEPTKPTEPENEGNTEEAPAEEAPVEEAPAEEAPAPEAPAEEAPAPREVKKAPITIRFADDDEDGERRGDIDGEVVLVRFRTSFESRYIQSGALQDYYTAIKNALLSYKGVKARTSWNYESFNKGRVQLAKLNIKGNALLVNLALDPALYNQSKYHFTDMSDKPKFEKTPMLMKVKSDRALKYVLELIAEMMKTLEIPEGKPQNADYHMPYETTEALASRGLVKVILPAGMKLDENMSVVRVDVGELLADVKDDTADAPVVEAPAEETPVEEAPVEKEPAEEEPAEEAPTEEAPTEEAPTEEAPTEEAPTEEAHIEAVVEPIYVDAEHADIILTNEEATATIQIVHTGANQRKGKLAVVNLDVICENFNEGEVVSLETLREKRLVPKNAARIKVLARGIMTKALTVIASKYSLAAVKMIYLAGGVAELED